MIATRSEAGLLDDISRVLAGMQGGEFGSTLPRETRFFADLGLASIDAVVLGEALQRFYGRPLPYGDLLAELGGRADRDMTLGDLAAFLQRNL